MTTTNWLNTRDTKIEIPAKIRSWANGQAVRVVATNEAMEKWMRFDGEELVVRA